MPLAKNERPKCGTPAVAVIAEAVATSPCIARDNIANMPAELRDAVCALRGEPPSDVPDTEMAEAPRGCLDMWATQPKLTKIADICHVLLVELGATKRYRIHRNHTL